jgi:uncharacterized membrane protein (UPF0127 family)
MIVRNATRGTVIALRARPARGWLGRLLGLLPRSGLEAGEGLWLAPCRCIHTWGMRFPIDAIFVDRSLVVLAVLPRLRPFRISPWLTSCHAVLEVAAGRVESSRTERGDRLVLEDPRELDLGEPRGAVRGAAPEEL